VTTNILMTIVVSVITNWTPVHEQDWSGSQQYIFTPCGTHLGSIDTSCSIELTDQDGTPSTVYFPDLDSITFPPQKYVGDDGVVMEIEELHFMYKKTKCVVRVREKRLRTIQRRFTEKTVKEWREEIVK